MSKCTCPPKTNNQKDPTVLQVEFTPTFLLGAYQEDPTCPKHGTLPEVRVDFNTPPLEGRGDGRDEYTASWVGGLSLRQQVVVVDDDIRMLGRISGLRDLGYGRFLIVEVEGE